jgi:hypothetical protein
MTQSLLHSIELPLLLLARLENSEEDELVSFLPRGWCIDNYQLDSFVIAIEIEAETS